MADRAPELVDLEPQEAVTIRGTVALADLPAFFAKAFQEAAGAAAAAGVAIVGPPFAFYPETPTERVVVEAGFPVDGPVGELGAAHRFVLPGGRAAQTIHVGPYDTMESTYRSLLSWMASEGLEPAVAMWECYLSDPAEPADSWQTRIIWPIGRSGAAER